ncbi:MAG: DUF3656 domain-containing protein, partial [Sedimentisphaerales bacterium]|nr:DUF3656 domain-containing protein [Sedimentisphaerales bacterium]
ELIDAGITSFKIEGRLKDLSYVANTVGFYRQRLDSILARKGLRRSSSGTVHLHFQPNLNKSFNRGFTDYGLIKPAASIASIDTPKSIGEYVGTVTAVEEACFTLDAAHDLHSADGICFFDRQRNLSGTIVNRVDGRTVYPQKTTGIRKGQEIYRNFDYLFSRRLTGRIAERKVGITMLLHETPSGLLLSGIDEDGDQATVEIAGPMQPAQKKDATRRTIRTQLTKLGNTIFECSELRVQTRDVYFMVVSQLNAAKRDLVQQLLQSREANRPRPMGGARRNSVPFPEKHLTYLGNALNARARAFYRRHGVETICPAAESGLDLTGQLVMATKYCLRRELGLCSGPGFGNAAEPMTLEDEDGHQFEVRFRCGCCGMDVFFGKKEKTQ